MKKEDHSIFEKTIYSVIGGFIILSMAPGYIPYCLCFGGLMVSAYGIIDIINKSDAVSQFDIKSYIENANK